MTRRSPPGGQDRARRLAEVGEVLASKIGTPVGIRRRDGSIVEASITKPAGLFGIGVEVHCFRHRMNERICDAEAAWVLPG